MNLKILLIMPYFERPNMVLNALRSMESVNYDNYEFCIIDDGSTLNPIEDIIEKYKFNIKNLKILKTNDSIENKIKRGSIHGSFMNRAMRESNADIIVMMSDDDALHKDYFSNLNTFYKANKDIMYSYCHIIPFDPFEQISCDTLKHYNQNKEWSTKAVSGLNWTIPINPFCKIDATQVSWRAECNKIHNVWLPEEQTKNLDASFYNDMYNKFGNCVFNGAIGIYKGLHVQQLTNREGVEQFKPADSKIKTNYISICTNFKNESKYLKEWIDYHISIGIEHFYLYDNNSSDDYKIILKPYYENGFITLKKVDDGTIKEKVYNDFMKNYRFKNYWIAFIDCDEFITLRNDKNIKSFLQNYERYPAVGLNWLMFGSAGLDYNETNSVLNMFTKCNNPNNNEHNNVSCHIKTILNPRKAIPQYINPHFNIYDTIMSYPQPPLAVDTDKQFITGQNEKNDGEKYYFAATDQPKFDTAFIRHFWSKSKKEFFERRLNVIRDDNGKQRYENEKQCELEFNIMNKYYNELEYSKFIGD